MGKKKDWGKTKPYWCLRCGEGYAAVEGVLKHYRKTRHGNTKSTHYNGMGFRGRLKRAEEKVL